ncbi:hypothetical protein Lpp14_03141, partial [Lacticaseibacillus paracasei subsp. paracasei Lpp14]
ETPGAAFAKQRNQQSQVDNDPWKQK